MTVSAVVALLIVVVTTGASLAAGRSAHAHAAYAKPCADPYSSIRDPNDPLMLPVAPGAADPLRGANFFVDGPAHGAAAGAVARLLGFGANGAALTKSFADSDSWAEFSQYVARVLPTQSVTVQHDVDELEKIASEPEAQRFSSGNEGGSPSEIADFVRKLFCHNFTADPGSIPIISTYFLHPVLHGCATTKQIDAYMPLFKQRINAVVSQTGNRPVVYLLELDAIGSSSCFYKLHSMPAWEAALRYEVDRFATLPHAVVYVEAGYSDGPRPSYSAKILNKIDIRKIQGFFTNDTHINWAINEIKWGEQISRMTHGAHFVVNTAQDGNGPLLNKHPGQEGVEDLCNPPGRGLGPKPTTTTGFPPVDALLWTAVPGNSSGPCEGGPASGVFWAARAIQLAADADERLGPDFASDPY
jgi:endoglucanase